jgi:thymidylate kinase
LSESEQTGLNADLRQCAKARLPPEIEGAAVPASRPRRRARLCVVDGIDGAGKTTLARELASSIADYGLRVTLTRQPTNLVSGTHVRRLATTRPSARALAQALIQDRHAQYYSIFRTAFQISDVIICDRYFYSAVYQSKNISHLHSQIAFYRRFLPIPDITFLLLPSTMEARRRILESNRKLDRFEQTMHSYHRLYYSLRKHHEVVLLSKRQPLSEIRELCVSKILTKCGIFGNQE